MAAETPGNPYVSRSASRRSVSAIRIAAGPEAGFDVSGPTIDLIEYGLGVGPEGLGEAAWTGDAGAPDDSPAEDAAVGVGAAEGTEGSGVDPGVGP